MRLLHLFTAGFLVAALWSRPQAVAVQPATLKKADLGQRFLLQISYEQKSIGFNTSRSRIVTFEREDAVLRMLDMLGTQGSDPTRVLATIPITSETRSTLDIDLNAGFDTVSNEEDRTGEDYNGRVDTPRC